MLTLAAQALQQTKDPAEIINRLVDAEEVVQFLMAEVDEGLAPEEQLVMKGVAALLGRPGTTDAIETAVDIANVRRTLTYLTNRFLLHVLDGPRAKEYREHDIVREFYYGLLSKRELRAIHRRCGIYYEQEELDPLRAAQHFVRAGDAQKAIRLITDSLTSLLHRGDSMQIMTVLAAAELDVLPLESKIDLHLAQAEALRFRGRSEEAQAVCQQALGQLAAMAPSPWVTSRRAQAAQLMARILDRGDPQAAQSWAQQAVDLLAPVDPQRAGMYVVLASTFARAGRFDEARQSVELALGALGSRRDETYIDALTTMGSLLSVRGDIVAGAAATAEALALAQTLDDPFRTVRLMMNIGLDKADAGALEEGIRYQQDALKVAERIGSLEMQADLCVNLGDLLLIRATRCRRRLPYARN
ncbi:MAG: hypothetical protein IPK16_29875 [Anaerolineales bacterium]|nr:hypothetical protein [Anaerolineales bacterium]